MANLPASCPTGTTANVNGRMLDAGAHVFHVEHPCFTTGAANHTQQIQKAIDATLLNPADPTIGAGTVVFEAGKVYMVESLAVHAGITLDLNGATLRRIAPVQGEDPALKANRVTFHTLHRVWSSAEDSPLLTIRNGTLDGNRTTQGAYTNHQLEHAHLIHLRGDKLKAGRLRAKIEDIVFRDSVADGVQVDVNTDLQMANVRAVDCFRGGLVVTGGYSKVQVTNMRTGGTVHPSGIDVEVDGTGYGGTLAIDLQMVNVECEANMGIFIAPGSTVLGSNVHVRAPVWTFSGGGEPAAGERRSVVRFANSSFGVGVADSVENRLVHPGDITFTGCTFVVSEAGYAEGNHLVGLSVYWNTGNSAYKGQRVRLIDCEWRVAGDVELSDTVRAVMCTSDYPGYDNRLLVVNPEIPASFDAGVQLTQGGTAEIRGGTIRASTPFLLTASPNGYDVDVTIWDVDVSGAGAYMHLVAGSASSTIRTNGVMVAEADSGIGTDYGIGNTRFVGGRIIIVESSPVGRLPGLSGDVARLRVPVAGQTFEWACVTGSTSPSSTVWKALSTLAA